MCYVYSVFNLYSCDELSIYVFFVLSLDKPAEVYKLLLYYDLFLIRNFNIFFNE